VIIKTSEKAKFEYFVDDEISDVGSVPICTVSKFYRGRTVAIGSTDFLLESELGIDAGDNYKFARNIIKWLLFEI
jgi:hypothetical protein